MKKLHVSILYNTKITDSKKVGEKYEISLSNGEKKVVDLYLPTSGVKPNTEWISNKFLNEKGELKVDEFLRVKGAEDVWAAGDVVDTEPSQLTHARKLYFTSHIECHNLRVNILIQCFANSQACCSRCEESRTGVQR